MRLVLILLILTAALTSSFGSVTSMSEQGQAFKVGTLTFQLENSKVSPTRSIEVQVWYPVSAKRFDSGDSGSVRPSGDASACLKNAAVAEGRFPLLFFFPGWGARVQDNAVLLQNLAGGGFVVAGLSYPTGEGLPDPAVPMQFSSAGAYAAGTAQGDRMVRIQSEDASLLLDVFSHLESADPAGRLAGHVWPSRAGLLGYSLGGSVAAETALRDERFHAIMNLDGWMFFEVAKQFFRQPYLVFKDDLAPPTAEDLAAPDSFRRNFSRLRATDAEHQDSQLARSGGFRVTIQGSSHSTFSDTALLKGAQNLGPISPQLAMEIVSAYTVEFFAKYLKGQHSPLLDERVSRFPEAKLEVFPSRPSLK